MGSLRFELKTSAMSRLITIEEKTLNEYLDTIELSGILTAMNGGASYEARFAIVGSESKEVCSSR